MALDGQTPAEVNGLQVKGWKELLERAVKEAQCSMDLRTRS